MKRFSKRRFRSRLWNPENVLPLDLSRKKVTKAQGESDFYLQPYFEAIFEPEFPAERLFILDSFEIEIGSGRRRTLFEIQTSNFEIWPDKLRAHIRIVDKTNLKIGGNLRSYTEILMFQLERLATIFMDNSPSLKTEKLETEPAREFVPSKVFVQSKQSVETCESVLLQLWIIHLNPRGDIEWAGSLGEQFFIYSEGRLVDR